MYWYIIKCVYINKILYVNIAYNYEGLRPPKMWPMRTIPKFQFKFSIIIYMYHLIYIRLKYCL